MNIATSFKSLPPTTQTNRDKTAMTMTYTFIGLEMFNSKLEAMVLNAITDLSFAFTIYSLLRSLVYEGWWLVK